MREAYLSGRLGKDPELFSPDNGEYSVLNFSIANDDENRKNQMGEYEHITSWFDVEYWTKKPQEWLQRLHKGDMVFLSCEAKQDRWEKDGQQRSRIKFIVRFGTFPYVVPKRGSEPGQQQDSRAIGADDDIPF